ncbi:MAG TPA: SGNH/GDSL hydrolase family protein [Chloroflexota bacterium]|nr:SGNH/GDSL hydrolase family protein [Chloroflexota bacterium]
MGNNTLNLGTPRSGHPIRRLALTALLLAAALALPGGARTARAAGLVGPRAIYLALGDSAAWGYQPNGDAYHGYADDLNAYFKLRTGGRTTLVNLACQGENSTSFIDGGCYWKQLNKQQYPGSQLQAALYVIHQYRGQVSPVTIDIGPTDFGSLIGRNDCYTPPVDLGTQILATFDANFTYTLSQLKTALGGTGDLLTMNFPFPDQGQCAAAEPLIRIFNQHIAADAARYGVPVADAFDAFGGFSAPNPATCSFTWICSTYQDEHPTTAGYAALAVAFEAAAHY